MNLFTQITIQVASGDVREVTGPADMCSYELDFMNS